MKFTINPFKMPLWVQMILALVLSIPLGILLGSVVSDGGLADNFVFSAIDGVGQLFLSALKISVVPLVFLGMILSVKSLRSEENKGLAGKSLIFFLSVVCYSVTVCAIITYFLHPGVVSGKGVLAGVDLSGTGQFTQGTTKLSVGGFIKSLMDPNLVGALSTNSNLLSLMVFAIAFSIILGQIDDKQSSRTIMSIISGLFDVFIQFIKYVIEYGSFIGVLCLMIKTFADIWQKFNGEAMASFLGGILWLYIASFTCYLVLAGSYFAFLAIKKKISFKRFMGGSSAFLTAFSSASSAAAMPVNIQCLVDQGYPEESSTAIIVAAATLSKPGSASFFCIACIWVIEAVVGPDQLTLASIATLIIISVLFSFSIPSIPMASLVIIASVLSSMEGTYGGTDALVAVLPLLISVDALLDRGRTTINSVCQYSSALLLDNPETISEVTSNHLIKEKPSGNENKL
ncbi:hypothetical protein PCE1_004585 [Barthelona sp. PCE]